MFTPDLSTDLAVTGILRTARLELLCAYLDELPPERFNFAVIAGEGHCGTVGCAIGHTPFVFPALMEWERDGYNGALTGVTVSESHEWSFDVVAKQLFGVPAYMADNLFSPNMQRRVSPVLSPCGNYASAKEVAAMLRQFIALVRAGSITGLVAEEGGR